MATYLKNMDWIKDPQFVCAYAKGMDSGHKMGRPKLNAFARSRGVKIAALPTGQGLLIKP